MQAAKSVPGPRFADWGTVEKMLRFAVAAAAMLAAAPVAGQSIPLPDPKLQTVGDVYAEVVSNCERTYNYANPGEEEKAAVRKMVAVSDRLVTREVEGRISDTVGKIDTCVTRLWDAAVVKREADPATKTALTNFAASRSTDLRLKHTENLRKLLSSLGYRPSSAAPAPRYGFCEINDDYEVNGNYVSNLHVSRVFIDRDPEAEIAARDVGYMSVDPKTAAGQRVLNAMEEWVRLRWKPANERDWMRCYFYPTAAEAQRELEATKAKWGEDVQDTNIG